MMQAPVITAALLVSPVLMVCLVFCLLTVDDGHAGGHDRPPVYKALLLNAADAWREVMVLQRRLEALSASPEKNLPRSWWLRLLQRGTRS